MHACLFSNLHVSLPFDNFTVGVLRALNVDPTQLHPNTWASIQAFSLICDVFRLSPTPSHFLSYYTSHPTKLALWHSLVGHSGNVLFGSFATSYKNLKEKFPKVFICPEGAKYFFDEVGRSKFPLSWTSKSTEFKEWSPPPLSTKEKEIYSPFDGFPCKLPMRKLVAVYTSPQCWEAFKGTIICLFSVDFGFFSLLG